MSQTETISTGNTVVGQGVTPADPPAVEQDDIAATSTADEGEKSVRDAVLSALDDSEDPPSEDEPGSNADKADDAETEKKDAEPDAEDDEFTEAEKAKLNSKTRERIQKLLDQRHETRQQAETLKSEIEQLRPEAEGHRKIQAYLRENSISAEQAGQALFLAGLMQSDPEAAYRQLEPVLRDLASRVGVSLPEDLMNDVRQGNITQDRAAELAKARAQATEAERRQSALAERTKAEAAAREAEQRSEHVGRMAKLGDALAAEKAQADPDWNAKQSFVADRLRRDIQENGLPKDEKDLRTRFAKAVGDVTLEFQKIVPGKPKPIRPVASTGSSAEVQTPPKSAREAVLRALD